MNENGDITSNKGRLIAQGYSQEEGINFEETYAFLKLEAVRILLTFTVTSLLSYFRWMSRAPS